jgi:hypothetical protein
MFAESLLERADALIVTSAGGIWGRHYSSQAIADRCDLKRICTAPISLGSQKALTVVVSTRSSTGGAWGDD